MLTQLTINNFGLIDRLSLSFTGHLNILTGETGAGKSILLDAVRFLLGERFESTHMRDTGKLCIVQGTFELVSKDLQKHPLFADYLTDGIELIIERSFSSDGRSKVKLNGFSLTVSQLKEIGNHLIDFHGAHDHQLLFSETEHLKILDKLIEFGTLKTEYERVYKEFVRLTHELDQLTALSQTRQRDLDLLIHQVKELEQVPLTDQAYDEIMAEQLKINNAQRLHDHIERALAAFESEDGGIEDLLRRAFSPLKSLSQVDPGTASYLDQLNSIQETTHDLVASLHNYSESLNFDEESANEVMRKYDIYTDIKRKYGPTLNDAQKFYTEIKNKHDLLKDFEHNDAKLRDEITATQKELTKIAAKMTQKRNAAAGKLKETIEKELKELGIHHVQFEARIQKGAFHTSGHDEVAFYISPNAGEALKPLAQIVSSGEAARVMLALKKALIDVDPIPVLIFDEIDAQIGGRLGTITGKKLKELSKNRQVILITHLPQIASFADAHFKVVKVVKSGRTFTEVHDLKREDRVKEIAQMMSGQKESKISISHAEDMLAQAKKI